MRCGVEISDPSRFDTRFGNPSTYSLTKDQPAPATASS